MNQLIVNPTSLFAAGTEPAARRPLVAIIGGGVSGAATAFYLAQAKQGRLNTSTAHAFYVHMMYLVGCVSASGGSSSH